MVIALVAAACAGADAEQGAGALEPAAAWVSQPLTEVRSGETFRIADLAGRVVIVEPMAAWCVNCREQQKRAQAALAELPEDSVAYVSIDVDPSEDPETLARYASDQGFDWRFAIADREFSRSLSDQFGAIVLSPPSTPLIVLGPDGSVIKQHIGGLGSDDLVALVESSLE